MLNGLVGASQMGAQITWQFYGYSMMMDGNDQVFTISIPLHEASAQGVASASSKRCFIKMGVQTGIYNLRFANQVDARTIHV